MFHDSGEGRYPKSKAVLKSKLKVEVLVQGVEVDVVVLDGGGMLDSSIYWPKDGLVRDLSAVLKCTSQSYYSALMCTLLLITISKKALNQILYSKDLEIFNGRTNFELKHHNLPKKCACHL